ncbi:hypothetical protein PUNSTDRAFT_43587 [Punctularia strigosozonata HHB-11173 SS5]|uniref:uncharacterized protein n=1 Tax=Punctularia strigosozonata (strain HHB-11173) TaxID=741275 RepID=UPI0004417365|nr:uncharacterized protein PUNSTDRAFT_43587 [Punctularia strigosozonata HHB-11173 SS5]EIN10795.1 hypothetical protein PUNSTDRAFT_43587 [Punctularia strigosozonata HHB-11173 SS5]
MLQTLEISLIDTGRSPKRARADEDDPQSLTDSEARSGERNTIDDLDSRPRIPLPQRSIWPSPTAPPTFTDENPHIQTSRRGDPPTARPTDQSVEFLDVVFPRIGLSMADLLEGMETAQTTPVLANPGDFLAIVPFNAGQDLFAARPTLHADILEFIVALRIDVGPPSESVGNAKRRLDTHRPLAKKNSRRSFDKPWTILLTGCNSHERAYLLYQQTFAVNEDICFHVLSFDPNYYEWTIMHISGDAVRAAEDQEALPEVKNEILTAIKTVLWKDKPFRNFVDQVLRAAGIPGTVNDRVAYATSSFTLTYIPLRNQQGRLDPVMQLMGRPIATNYDEHRRWLALIRKPSYYVKGGLKKLLIEKKDIECALCKSVTHPAWDCPFPKIAGWSGPTEAKPTRARSNNDNDRGNMHPGRGRRGTSRGRGGARASNRRGGWETVTRSQYGNRW